MYFRTVYPILGAYAEYFTIVRFYRILIKISRIHKYATTIWAGCVFSRVIACYPTVWREVMSKDKKLERCLRQLVKLGKRSGGYVTYQTINNVVKVNLNETTMNTIDHIYQHLKAEQIEIVDRLPGGIIVHTVSLSVERQYRRRYRQRTRKHRRRKKYVQGRKENEALSQIYSCPEKGIDELVWRWETKGELSERYFFNVIVKCGFSRLEVKQLVEYLGLLGIDYPEDYDRYFCEYERDEDKGTLSLTCLRRSFIRS